MESDCILNMYLPSAMQENRFRRKVVVYFDQCLGAAHSKRWLKYTTGGAYKPHL